MVTWVMAIPPTVNAIAEAAKEYHRKRTRNMELDLDNYTTHSIIVVMLGEAMAETILQAARYAMASGDRFKKLYGSEAADLLEELLHGMEHVVPSEEAELRNKLIAMSEE